MKTKESTHRIRVVREITTYGKRRCSMSCAALHQGTAECGLFGADLGWDHRASWHGYVRCAECVAATKGKGSAK